MKHNNTSPLSHATTYMNWQMMKNIQIQNQGENWRLRAEKK